MSLSNFLWFVVVIALLLWLLGFIGHVAGSLIHVLLFIAIVVVVVNIIVESRSL